MSSNTCPTCGGSGAGPRLIGSHNFFGRGSGQVESEPVERDLAKTRSTEPKNVPEGISRELQPSTEVDNPSITVTEVEQILFKYRRSVKGGPDGVWAISRHQAIDQILALIDQARAEGRREFAERVKSHHYLTQPSDFGDFVSEGHCIICNNKSGVCETVKDIDAELESKQGEAGE